MKSDVTRRVHTLGIKSVIFVEKCILILLVMDWHASLLREFNISEML